MGHSGTDADLVGRSIITDNSMSKLMRKDGSMIKTSYLQQTKGFAPKEFTKRTYGKTITLKYDGTKFRPEFPGDSPEASASKLGHLSKLDKISKLDESSTVLDVHMRSTMISGKSLHP
eukprot:CAMPEP_0170464312 /NCGR_PEP_ID=MMETSP0123-20130129/9093_1 /TAXON_ID=182087 /ORGANISM="Favella ehrenbergii, Strain Fehren 1" /LENGTH=117 /DNA_ID=CAMNT_0010729957 /DNA_START=645 /DNA_END=998 /DNA_ORIENTATION=-